MLKRSVVVTLQVEGVHYWPDCNLPEVIFLKDMHRHMFHIEACKQVDHNNRDVEIIMLKRDIGKALGEFEGNFGDMSCEDIAEELITRFDLMYCKVLEDGENGAYLWNS